ncbi:MAG: hypothetical protein DRP42_06180, partial [Tenericutes bacterium]
MQHYVKILFLLSSVSLSQIAIQTDWSGGAGVPGPVTDWGNYYDSSSGIDSAGGILQLSDTLLSNPVEHIVDGNYSSPTSVYPVDVDGDGDVDMVGSAIYAPEITWWENKDGSGITWIQHVVTNSFGSASAVYAADLNGDGYTDILGAGMSDSKIAWWENTDSIGTQWDEHIIDSSTDNAYSIIAADINNDGYLDVLSYDHDTADKVSWWENTDGSGTAWVRNTIDDDFWAISVSAADINGDGDMDALGAAPYSYINDVVWWENSDSIGTEWTKHLVVGGHIGVWSLYSADIDDDGDLDILGAAAIVNKIIWWENT